ncbi:unnamed protein product [Parajaminaea phylloscopi]
MEENSPLLPASHRIRSAWASRLQSVLIQNWKLCTALGAILITTTGLLCLSLLARQARKYWTPFGAAMGHLPWKFDPSEIESLREYYPGVSDDILLRTNLNFYYGSYEVGWMAIFFMYAFLGGLVILNFIVAMVPRSWLPRFLKTHILNAPLVRSKHKVPASIGFKKFGIEVRVPLRFQTFVIFVLFMANLVPLCTFYPHFDEDAYWPGKAGILTERLRNLADRTSVMAMGLLPLIILTAGRQPLSLVSGIDFGDSMIYHRWLARFCWTHINIHGFTWTAVEVPREGMKEVLSEPYWNWGIAAMALFWGLTLLSMRELRRKYYEIFVVTHVTFVVVGLVAVYFHIYLLGAPDSYGVYIVLTELAASLWALDRVMRWLNRIYLSLRASSERALTKAVVTDYDGVVCRLRVEVPKSRVTAVSERPTSKLWTRFRSAWKVQAGTSVRILIPRLQSWSDHPFTVIDADHSDEGSQSGFIDLLIRPQAGMTKALMDKTVNKDESSTAESSSRQRSAEFFVVLEGPYGSKHGHSIIAHDDVLLFAGGVGVAFSLPYFAMAALHGTGSRCKLVWAVREPEMLASVEDQLLRLDAKLSAKGSPSSHSQVVVEMHVTAGELVDNDDDSAAAVTTMPAIGHSASASSRSSAQDRDSTEAGEPSIKSEVEEKKLHSSGDLINTLRQRLSPAIELVVKKGRPSTLPRDHFDPVDSQHKSLAVMACGPHALCDDTRFGALDALSGRQWRDVEYVEECFDW